MKFRFSHLVKNHKMFKSKPASSRLRLTKENCLWLLFFFFADACFIFIYFFIIYLWVYWLSGAALRLLVAVCRLLSRCGLWAPERKDPVLQCAGLVVRFQACGILVPQGPGIKSKSPALEAGFLTTGLPVVHILSGKYFPTSLPSIQFGFFFFSFLAVILLMEGGIIFISVQECFTYSLM